MLFWTTVKLSIKSLYTNKLRSFLAMLGIIIGVAAVISMLALGKGAKKQVMDRISAMGTNLLIVRPGQRGHHGVRSTEQQNLKVKDAQALLKGVPAVAKISPVVRGSGQFKYFSKNSRSSIYGTAETYFSIRNYEIGSGRTFTELEVERRAKVAVLGSQLVENLFGKAKPLGEIVKIGKLNFLVIGVLKARGDQGWFNPDDQAILPYTITMKQILGKDSLSEIDLQLDEGADQKKAQAEISKILRRQHKIQEGKPDDFSIRNRADLVETASNMTQTFTVLLAGIASISLLVGGIGIMNIMLVTVTERTREIGIRKAIGAKSRDVLRQFLIEALLMSGIGGVFGVLAGIGIARLVSHATQFATVIEVSSVILALSFSCAIGVFFGFYPARQAASLDPIEALRYE
ncbi:ABC transporter permease [Candidatus Riflebacteria bacterium]